MNKDEAWLEFKNAHPRMLEAALGKEVNDVFTKIQKSGILNRFGVNQKATGNFEVLIEIFTKKAHDAGWDAREKQSLTNIVITSETK